jgi:hypothetical protein
MEKFYCKSCKSVIYSDDWYPARNKACPLCGWNGTIRPIPDYETPQQYEKRTGKPVSDDTAVFYRLKYSEEFSVWKILPLWELKNHIACYSNLEYQILIADPPVPPHDNWRPE